MEVTRQLREEKINKKGLAPIQLTFCWDRLRLRLFSGQQCRPADWNEKTGKVKDKPGSYSTQVNAVLERWSLAATTAHQDAKAKLQRWDKERMEAEIRVRYLRLAAEAAGTPAEELEPLPEVAAPPLTLLQHMDRWVEYQEGKVSLRSGKGLSKTYIRRLKSLREELAKFEKLKKYPLSFASIDASFYTKYQDYQLKTLGNKVNTFSGYIKNIKNFLYWCEEHGLPVTPKFHHFDTPQQYIGAEAFTQAELLAWEAVDFTTPEALAYLTRSITLYERKPGQRGGRPGLTMEQHLERIEQARDKMLQCCYLGLRISDADVMGPQHIHGDLVKIDAGKTGGRCIIPFFDDDVFKPVQLVKKYEHLALPTCLPDLPTIDDYLPLIAHLAGITRIHVTTRVGRKTFATLKIYQGVPKSQVMLATGHKTESSFNRYLGIDEEELIAIYRRTARRV